MMTIGGEDPIVGRNQRHIARAAPFFEGGTGGGNGRGSGSVSSIRLISDTILGGFHNGHSVLSSLPLFSFSLPLR